MLKLENTVLPSPEQWERIIMGMRNPMNSWARSDSEVLSNDLIDAMGSNLAIPGFCLGSNDSDLMKHLVDGGPVHAKFRRMIAVYVDVTAPLYWWKEFDTYKVGTVANSCSTMHKIHEKEFTLEDFSCEHLLSCPSEEVFMMTMGALNIARNLYLACEDPTAKKNWWWQMIQLLPSSYNQKRTLMLNYEVLASIYEWRHNHKLDEWHTFCDWIEELPYAEDLILRGIKEAE